MWLSFTASIGWLDIFVRLQLDLLFFIKTAEVLSVLEVPLPLLSLGVEAAALLRRIKKGIRSACYWR